MNDPRTRIRAGIDDIDARKLAAFRPKLLPLIGIKSGIPNLQEIQVAAKKANARLQVLRAAEITDARTAADTIKATWKDRGVSIDDKGIRSDEFGATKRRRFVETDIKAARTERLAATADERARLVTTLREAKESLSVMRRNWTNPVSVLMTSTLASGKRATYAANLAHAGAYELENALRAALQGGDKDLAAACLVRYDAMSAKTRELVSFGKEDVAAAMVFDEWSKAVEAIGMADYSIESGELAEREMRGDRISPDAKIRVGLRLTELAIKIGRPVEGDTGGGDGQRESEDFTAYLDRKYPGGPLPSGYTFVDGGQSDG